MKLSCIFLATLSIALASAEYETTETPTDTTNRTDGGSLDLCGCSCTVGEMHSEIRDGFEAVDNFAKQHLMMEEGACPFYVVATNNDCGQIAMVTTHVNDAIKKFSGEHEYEEYEPIEYEGASGEYENVTVEYEYENKTEYEYENKTTTEYEPRGHEYENSPRRLRADTTEEPKEYEYEASADDEYEGKNVTESCEGAFTTEEVDGSCADKNLDFVVCGCTCTLTFPPEGDCAWDTTVNNAWIIATTLAEKSHEHTDQCAFSSNDMVAAHMSKAPKEPIDCTKANGVNLSVAYHMGVPAQYKSWPVVQSAGLVADAITNSGGVLTCSGQLVVT